MSSSINAHSLMLQRPPLEPIARLTQPLTGLTLSGDYQDIFQDEFINHVNRLAALLPDSQHVINLCDNRYLFLVSLCAVIVREQTNLLPPNKNVSTQIQLGKRYENSLILHDGCTDIALDQPNFDVSVINWSLDKTKAKLPLISNNHKAVISFTSGSTGQSKPNIKLWRTLTSSSKINAQHMLINASVCHSHVATVPGQHMWGFETSVLLAMFANVCLVDARPFFAHDIRSTLDKLPAPCTLISAPLHLKTFINTPMIDEQKTITAPLASVLCATSPLDQPLASRVENRLKTTLMEVFGCSEVGSMAIRKTARQLDWTTFNGLNFSKIGTKTSVSADHLLDTVELEDHLHFTENGKFRLAGRSSDQIKIAGKRGSLAEVNAVLNTFEGLVDGTVFFPPQNRNVPRLVALVELKESYSKKKLREHMALHLDAAFVPRPILIIDRLPREENGKLSKAKVLELYNERTSS